VLEQAASLLAAAAMPVVMLPGNHDPAMADCLYARAGVAGLRQVRVLGVTDGDAIDFARHELRICGRAHRDYADMTPLATRWPRQTPRQVVMAHGHYVPAADWKSQAHRAWKISDDDLANTDADYIALGHWDVATPVGDRRVPAYYSGSPDVAGTVNLIRLSSLGTEVAREPLVWPRGD